MRLDLHLGDGETLGVFVTIGAKGELRDCWPMRDGLRHASQRVKEAAHTIDVLGNLLRSDGWDLAGLEARTRLQLDVLGRLRVAVKPFEPKPCV